LLATFVASPGHAAVADGAGKPLGMERGEGGLKDVSEDEQFF